MKLSDLNPKDYQVENQPLKLSNLDPSHYQVEANSSQAPAVAADDEPSALKAAGLGAVNLFNAAPVVAGAASAGKSLLDILAGTGSLSDVGDAYSKGRDDAQSAIDKAQKAHPLAYAGGSVVGGLIPSLLTAGAGAPAELSALEKISEAAKIGMGYGAASGLGESLSKGQGVSDTLNNVASNALTGGATGGVIGGAIQGVKGLANASDSVLGTRLASGAQMGAEGDNLFSKSSRNAIKGEAKPLAQELYDTLTDLKSDAGKQISKVVKDASQGGNKLNAESLYNKLTKRISELDENDPAEASDKKVLTNLVSRTFGGKDQVKTQNFKTFAPPTTETIPGTPSSAELAQQQIDKRAMKAAALGQDLKGAVNQQMDTQGNIFDVPTTVSDEQIGASERVNEKALEPSEPEETAKDSTQEKEEKPVKTFNEISDKSIKDSQGLAAAKNSWEKLQAVKNNRPVQNIYKVIVDKVEGVIHVVKEPASAVEAVENTAAEPSVAAPAAAVAMPEQPSVLDPGNSENNFKSTSWAGEPIPNSPGTPAQTVTTPGDVTNGSFDYTQKGTNNVAPTGLQDMKQGAQALSKFQNDSLKSQTGKNLAQLIAGDTGDVMETHVPGYEDANKDFHALTGDDGIFNQLGIKGKKQLTAINKLKKLIYRYDNDTATGDNAKDSIDSALSGVRKLDPDLADSLQSRVDRTSGRIETARVAGNEGFDNKSGGMFGVIKGASTLTANATGLASHYLAEMPKERLGQLGQSLIQSNSEVGQKLGNILMNASQKDDIGRNALIYSLMQNPAYREMMNNLQKQ